MPLISGLPSLQKELASMYGDTGEVKDADVFASKTAEAICSFVKTGMPMTMITTFPGAVNGAMTAAVVTGKGIGGIDKPVPGMGLAAAKALLEQELTMAFTHGGAQTVAQAQAQKIAMAIMNYFSQAIVMTNDKTDAPLAAPPPAGPVTGSITGQGGVLSDAPGKGYDSAKSDLESDLKKIFAKVDDKGSASDKAKQMAEAIHKFCSEGKVQTQGTFVAPAVVAPPPAPPNGAYLPGQGMSASSSLS
jgi:hypothetical protein